MQISQSSPVLTGGAQSVQTNAKGFPGTASTRQQLGDMAPQSVYKYSLVPPTSSTNTVAVLARNGRFHAYMRLLSGRPFLLQARPNRMTLFFHDVVEHAG
jgi:hypothetical protein